MATLKHIANRLKSVTNIQKITKSMKMVSAAKFNRAERELRGARPLGEGTQIFFDKAKVYETESVTKADNLLIAVTSDKGLCGSVHAQVSKAVKAEIDKKKSVDSTRIICIGDKSRALLQRNFANNIIFVANDVGRLPPTFLDASKIAQQIQKFKFSSGKIMFNKYKSIVSYKVENVAIFSEDSVLNASNSVVYDSLDDDILESFLEFSLVSLLYYTMKENACSEQASRMSAMDNASKNAGDMINMLTLKLNRTRQAAITRELIEIISGAAALK